MLNELTQNKTNKQTKNKTKKKKKKWKRKKKKKKPKLIKMLKKKKNLHITGHPWRQATEKRRERTEQLLPVLAFVCLSHAAVT